MNKKLEQEQNENDLKFHEEIEIIRVHTILQNKLYLTEESKFY